MRVVRVAWLELAVAGGVGGAGRPGGPGGVGVGGAGRPGGVAGVGGAGGIGGAGRPTRQPTGGAGAQRPGGAFGDMSGGRQAGQFGQRGAQSRSVAQRQSFGGGVAVLEGRRPAVDVPVVDVAGGVRRSSMGAPKSWLCSILAAILWTGIAQAAPANAPEPQRSFASAEDAAKAFVAALRDNKKADLRAMLGPEADRVINSGDWYGDQELHQHFVALYEEKHTIDEKVPGRAELNVGPNDWPLPIPLVESNGRWMFDTNAGAQTIVDRRIGRNELSAIRTLLACADAQHDYFERAKQVNGSGVYAARLVSTPGATTACTGRLPRARPKARWDR